VCVCVCVCVCARVRACVRVYRLQNITNKFYIKEMNKVYFLNNIKITIVIITIKI